MAATTFSPEAALESLGFRIRNATDYDLAVTAFQIGWSLNPGKPLAVDGKVGPKTIAALKASLAAQKAGTGTASKHFSFAEFTCKCGGRKACRRILVQKSLLRSLEDYREVAGPTAIISGYRCPQHNKAVGGATKSQHVDGTAADIKPVLHHRKVAGLRLFSGIGYKRSTGKVSHVDRRDAGPNNLTRGTKDHPTTWVYAS